ncbi:MAG: hypothetical protein KAH17_08630 [Bacteroidales bacterium]|nr:hypothetical protein [Bacteroidales bacterium]
MSNKAYIIIILLLLTFVSYSQDLNYLLLIEQVEGTNLVAAIPESTNNLDEKIDLYWNDGIVSLEKSTTTSRTMENAVHYNHQTFNKGKRISKRSYFDLLLLRDAFVRIKNNQFPNLFSDEDLESLKNNEKITELIDNPYKVALSSPSGLSYRTNHIRKLNEIGYYNIVSKSTLLNDADFEIIKAKIVENIPSYIIITLGTEFDNDTLDLKENFDGVIKVKVFFTPNFFSESKALSANRLSYFERILCSIEIEIDHYDNSKFIDHKTDSWQNKRTLSWAKYPMTAANVSVEKLPPLKLYLSGYLQSFRHPKFGISLQYKNYGCFSSNAVDLLTREFQPFNNLFFDLDIHIYPYLSINYKGNYSMYINNNSKYIDLPVDQNYLSSSDIVDFYSEGLGTLNAIGIKLAYPVSKNISIAVSPNLAFYNVSFAAYPVYRNQPNLSTNKVISDHGYLGQKSDSDFVFPIYESDNINLQGLTFDIGLRFKFLKVVELELAYEHFSTLLGTNKYSGEFVGLNNLRYHLLAIGLGVKL